MQLKAHALEVKWLPVSAIWKMKKALWEEQENFLRGVFTSLNNNQKERHCSKVTLVMNWERWKKIASQFTIMQMMTAYLWSWLLTVVGHLFQNYDTIYMRFFPMCTCNHSCYTIYAGLSLRAGGRGFPPATQSMAPGYFHVKLNQKSTPLKHTKTIHQTKCKFHLQKV